jgi:hypothetical protein
VSKSVNPALPALACISKLSLLNERSFKAH